MNKVLVDRELLERAAKRLTDWLELNDCECESGHYCGRDDVTRDRNAIRTILAQQAEPAPAQDELEAEQSGLYTCIGKGGAYELIGRAKTAGVLKVTGRFADEVIVYRDTKSNALYCREPGDFRLRMARAAIDDAMRQT